MKKVDLLQLAHISTSAPAKLGKDEYVSMAVLVKLSIALDADIGDIIGLETSIPKGDD